MVRAQGVDGAVAQARAQRPEPEHDERPADQALAPGGDQLDGRKHVKAVAVPALAHRITVKPEHVLNAHGIEVVHCDRGGQQGTG